MAAPILDSMNEEEKFALLFGIMLGDGCLSRFSPKDRKERKLVVITGNLIDDRNFFEDTLVPILKSFTTRSVRIKERKDCNAIEIQVSDKLLFERINFMGFPIGKKGASIKIPEHFYKNNLVKYVIQGFFATDGSLVLTKNPNKFYPRLESQAICKDLLKQIHSHLVKLGLNGHFYESKSRPHPKWKNSQKKYKFQFNGKKNLFLFSELIGFANPKHQKRFLGFLGYSMRYDKIVKGTSLKSRKIARERVHFSLEWLRGESNSRPPAYETGDLKPLIY